MELTTLTAAPTTAAASPAGPNSFADLRSEDFFKLLLTQLRHQDPLEPTGNEELLRQISSIRDIELSTTLSESLRVLTGQQRFASASSLIGQYVLGVPDENGAIASGLVAGVRFDDGRPILQLSNGATLPLDQVGSITPPLSAAEALIGQAVIGVDHRTTGNAHPVEGVVTGVRMAERDEVVLELDTGGDLRFRDVLSVVTAET